MAGRWRRLPEELSAEERELVEALREMKDRSGLSLVELAARTHHSKSSWQRWFNGERPVTEQALRRLAEVSGTEPESVLPVFAAAMLRVADGAGEPPEETPEGVADEPGGGLPPRRRQLAYAAMALALVAAVAGLMAALWPGHAPRQAADGPTAPTTATATTTATTAPSGCLGVSCSGLDPKTTGCGTDAITLITANVQRMTIHMRYSPHCRAAWAKITNATPGDAASITAAQGGHQTALVHWGYDAYSPMLDASASNSGLQVCGEQGAARGCSQVITDPATAPVAPELLATPPSGPGATASTAGPEH
ncbi:DUF2690 domain-containing protein [Kitasatospora aureofaciens]|uniref:DUF2690 domain-containing protein n=1 Tax=Kitasatospora aureofaciens TaxID=1894 RepID=UPI001C48DEAA|nr:DUF2690 domain-containing protein [Kitasatospora aureofaciens]MBV6701958.1 DUF2690 domain-containing protein [Kitasatospora aureofaciens]